MSELWASISHSGIPGVVWLTCDIALDPGDMSALLSAAEQRPADVHTGMVKLWPASTGRDDWMWSHRGGTIGAPAATQDENAPVTYFSMDCVYTPRRLLELSMPAWAAWAWNAVDVKWSEIAAANGIEAHTVPECRPKHLHF